MAAGSHAELAQGSHEHPARFCYMYASPLVRKQGSKVVPIAKPLNLKAEQTSLINKLHDSGKSVVWEQHVASHETFANALPAKIDVLHYSGHGEPGELCGEDSHGQLTEITVKQVGDFLGLLKQRGTLPLVFVAACHSFNVGKVFMQAGSPHVVCINAKEQVMDEAALVFAKNFYGLLLEHACSVAVAFLTARNIIAGSYSAAEVDKFLLLPEPSSAVGARYSQPWLQELNSLHSHVPFPAAVSGPFVRAGRVTPGRVPTATDLLGRDLTLHTLYNSMVRSNYKCRFLNITGPPGVGKAALATSLAQYAHERTELNGFRGVYFFDAAEIASTVQRPRSSHGRDEHKLSPLERVVEELLDTMGVRDAAALSRRGLRHAADHLGASVGGSLFVMTHCDAEGRHGLDAGVAADIVTAVEGLFCRLVKTHRCSLLLTSREPVGHAWNLDGHHVERLEGLGPQHAAQYMLTQWQVSSRASRTLTPQEWGTHIPVTQLKTVLQRDQRAAYFKLVGASQLLRALRGNPRAIHEWVHAARGRTPAQHYRALLLEAGRILQKLELPLEASVLGDDVVDQLNASSPSTPFSPEPAGSGGSGGGASPEGLLRSASGPMGTPHSSSLPPPPHLRGAASSPAGVAGSAAAAGGGAGGASPQPQQQSFVPGGRSPNLGLPVSGSDYDLLSNQHEHDAPVLWSAWLSLLRLPHDTPALGICSAGRGEHETAGGPSLRFLVKEYVQARLPGVLSARPLQDVDITTMVNWVVAFAHSNASTQTTEVTQASLSNALMNRFVPWLGMMKTKLLTRWTQFVPASSTPVIQGFLDHNQALHLLQASKAALGTFLWRFSASSCTSVTATVLTVGTTGQHVAWNCRLTLTRLPSDATAYSARGVACPPNTPVWQYEWPKAPTALFVYDLEDFVARHSEMFRALLVGRNSSTYDDRAVVGLLGQEAMPFSASGGHPTLAHSQSNTVGAHISGPDSQSVSISDRPTFGMLRAHSESGSPSQSARPPQFM